MRIKLFAFALLAVTQFAVAQKSATKKKTSAAPKAAANTTKAPESKIDKLSYAIGVNFAKQFQSQNIDINPDMMFQAIKAIYSGGTPVMNEQQVMETLQNFEKEMQEKMQGESKKAAQGNKEKGKAWLAENKKRPGVIELPSGLQYEVIKEGAGESPKATSTVTTHYTGTLIDGTVFDSSVERGQPAQFPVNGVIKGWTEALQLMKPGTKLKLYIPSDLAYGDGGSPPKIGPGETLIFEVELISVDK
jgi:FKBP-type peptidyl-prolyl cis-trans isomerase FklB